MTMANAGECPQIKVKGRKELREEPCGKRALYRVYWEGAEGAVGYWAITLGTPDRPGELCRDCAVADAYSRNAGQRVKRGLEARAAAEGEEPAGAPEPAPGPPDGPEAA